MTAGQRVLVPGRFFFGWRMVALAGVLRFLAGGFHVFGFSVFFLPISRDLELSRAATSLLFSLARAEGALEAPAVGYLIDRFGPRLAMMVGSLLIGFGYILFSQAWGFIPLLLAYVLVVTPGSGSAFQHATVALTNNWFVRHRATAISVMSSAIPLGGALLTPVLTVTIYAVGWRWAAFLIGVTFLAVAFPMARLARNTPESMGLLPDGLPARESPAAMAVPALPARGSGTGDRALGTGGVPAAPAQRQDQDYSVRQAMRTPAFWVLVVASILRQAGFSAIMVHFVPILVWKGLAERTAALYVVPMALVSVVAHWSLGWLADRWSKPRILALGTASGAVALVILLYAEPGMVWLFPPLFVPVEALFPITWATVGDFFGRRHFATLRGFMITLMMVGPISAPVFAGRVFDTTQSYRLVLQVFSVCLFLSAAVFLLLRRPDPSPRQP
ncbi:MAG: MFS transporter [Chloroflexi bacterium]|nr:MFS transporter [Chloroflexota bacterium]